MLKVFSKTLTANDIGITGSHQAGLHIPKTNRNFIDFLPTLNSKDKNPSCWINCTDEYGDAWKFRYVHYNNKLLEPNGTRDEYRLTHTTAYFRSSSAMKNNEFIISKSSSDNNYVIEIKTTKNIIPNKLQLRGWRQVY